MTKHETLMCEIGARGEMAFDKSTSKYHVGDVIQTSYSAIGSLWAEEPSTVTHTGRWLEDINHCDTNGKMWKRI